MARMIHNFRCPVCGKELSEWECNHNNYGVWAISRAHKGIKVKSYMHTKCLKSTKKGGDQNGTPDVQH